MGTSGKRLMSIDALRGFDMLWIMGFSGAVAALCALVGAKDCWLAEQMSHVPWHGLRHHDTIFPLFLFLAGVSWPFSLAGQRAKGVPTRQIVFRCVKRMLVLTSLGLVMFGLLWFRFSEMRYGSVLGHIGGCWCAAALLSVFVRSWKARLGIAGGLLVVHWALLCFLRAPDAAALVASTDPAVAKVVASYAAYGTDGFSFVGNIAGWIDRVVMPGRLYETVFDPEGLLSKLTGTALAMLGVMAGELLRSGLPERRKTWLMVGLGVASALLALAWMPVCPVNKKLWTSTFVLMMAGYGFVALAAFHWIIDVKGCAKWAFAFRVIGMNSITIYLLMWLFSFRGTSMALFGGVASLGNEDWSQFVLLLGQVVVEWLVLLFLYRKNTFLRV